MVRATRAIWRPVVETRAKMAASCPPIVWSGREEHRPYIRASREIQPAVHWRHAATTGACGRNAPALRQCRHWDCRDHCHRWRVGLRPVERQTSFCRGGVAALRAAGLRRQIWARPPLSARFADRPRQPPLECGIRGRRRHGGGRVGHGRDHSVRARPAIESRPFWSLS